LKALAHTKNVERNIGVIDPKKVKLGSRKYYRYIGSLTVPPCTQDVVWTIVRKVISKLLKLRVRAVKSVNIYYSCESAIFHACNIS